MYSSRYSDKLNIGSELRSPSYYRGLEGCHSRTTRVKVPVLSKVTIDSITLDEACVLVELYRGGRALVYTCVIVSVPRQRYNIPHKKKRYIASKIYLSYNAILCVCRFAQI